MTSSAKRIAVRLRAGVVDLQHADARAVVDGGELVEPLARPRNALEELHVHLQSMARLRLLVALPALRRAAGASDSPAACACRACTECDAPSSQRRKRGGTASGSRRSCAGRSGSSAGGTESCSRPPAVSHSASVAASAAGRRGPRRRARRSASSTCRTDFLEMPKWRHARVTPRGLSCASCSNFDRRRTSRAWSSLVMGSPLSERRPIRHPCPGTSQPAPDSAS